MGMSGAGSTAVPSDWVKNLCAKRSRASTPSAGSASRQQGSTQRKATYKTSLAQRLRKAISQQEPGAGHSSEPRPSTADTAPAAQEERWLERMQRLVGNKYKTIANIRLQDAYDSLSAPQNTTAQARSRHPLHASQDRHLQREFSHCTQFSLSHYEISTNIPRNSDSLRRTKFIAGGGCLVPDRSHGMEEMASTRKLEYKPPNFRLPSSGLPLYQSTKGVKIKPYGGQNEDAVRDVDKRPNSAQLAARKTPKGPISTLEAHPNFSQFAEPSSFDFVSTYMAMKPGAHRLQKSKGLIEPLHPIRSVSEW